MAEPRLLIVDDDTGTCETLADIFREKGYSVATVGTGQEAIDSAEHRAFDVALIDIKLPDMDGTDLLREFKKRHPEMVSIIITGHASIHNMAQSLQEGANGYFMKPLVIEDVLNRVEEAVVKRRLEREIRKSEAKYRSLVETSADAIVSIDEEGKITQWNRAASRIFGHSEEEAMGKPFDIIIPGKDLQRYRENFKRFIQTGESELIGTTTELEGLRKDGTVIPVGISLSVLKREDSWMITGIIRDITERRRAEEELQHSLKKLREATGATIQAMAMTVETRDPYTAGHQKRVTDLARAIAREMGLSQEQIDGIRMAGVIHDLGKISVPAEILSKPGRLSGLEFGIIKNHPQVGYDILKTIKFPWPVARIVYQHHERMNGSGYPLGLSGEDILLEARILGVADVVEAMASHRPYRPALGVDKALEDISQNRGILFDPEAVDACLKVFTKDGFRFE
ncbi:MAG: PAS domain S-box protein [Deltaproteobacteria bacterium]|nr:PAS domain S-box protein [Deltaproteobacteria bacterium]